MLNEFEVKDKLEEERKDIHTEEDLFDYIKNIKKNYNYDYGVAPTAIAQAGLAVMNYLLCEMECTGFQASCSCWAVIEDFFNIKIGAKLIRYDDMLYPQYEDRFNSKVIPECAWKQLQAKAIERLESADEFVSPDVVKHWKSIACGQAPFGYRVGE